MIFDAWLDAVLLFVLAIPKDMGRYGKIGRLGNSCFPLFRAEGLTGWEANRLKLRDELPTPARTLRLDLCGATVLIVRSHATLSLDWDYFPDEFGK